MLPRLWPPLEQDLFLELRVEKRFHPEVQVFDAPEYEVADGPGRAIRVEDLETVAHGIGLVGDAFQGARRLLRQDGDRLLIAVDAVSDKVVSGVVADLLHDARHIVREQHEIRGVHDDFFFIIHNGLSCPVFSQYNTD